MAIELPTINVNVTLPTIALPNLSPRDLHNLRLPSLLNLSLPVPNLSLPVPNLRLPTLPNLSLSVPNLSLPTLPNLSPRDLHNLRLPSLLNLSLPTLPNLSVSMPNLGVSMPNLSVSMPNLSVSMPNLSVSMPNLSVSMPNLSVSMPNLGVSMPNLGVSMPNLGVSMPNLGVSMPNLGVSMPNLSLPTLPISLTMISCISNPLMIALNVVKGALSDNLEGLASGGKASLAALKKVGEDIKNKLKTMIILQLPVLPNFKAEYAMLLASVNNQVEFVKNALALEKKWGKALGIAVIRGLLDNIGKIDLCKGIPNIDGKLQADGTVIAIPKAQLSPIPAAPPAAHVPLVPTVQSATTQPTSGNSGVTWEEYVESRDLCNDVVDSVTSRFREKVQEYDRAFDKLEKDKVFIAFVKKLKKAKVGNADEYQKNHELTTAESSIIDRMVVILDSRESYELVRAIVARSVYHYVDLLAGLKTQEEYDAWYKEDVTDENLTLIYISNPLATRGFETSKIELARGKILVDEHKAILIKAPIYQKNSNSKK